MQTHAHCESCAPKPVAVTVPGPLPAAAPVAPVTTELPDAAPSAAALAAREKQALEELKRNAVEELDFALRVLLRQTHRSLCMMPCVSVSYLAEHMPPAMRTLVVKAVVPVVTNHLRTVLVERGYHCTRNADNIWVYPGGSSD